MEQNWYDFFQQGQEAIQKNNFEEAYQYYLKSGYFLCLQAKRESVSDEKAKIYKKATRILQLAEEIKIRQDLIQDKKKSILSSSQSGAGKNPKINKPISNNSDSNNSNSNNSENSEEDKDYIWKPIANPGVFFSDIAGLDNVKSLIENRVLAPFRNPELAKIYQRQAGVSVILWGPPGTGKTLLAKAIATELQFPFYSILSSDIMSKWVGEAEQRIKGLFETVRNNRPAVLFFDEAEALLAKRGSNSTVMNRVIPELLAQIQGVGNDTDGLLLIAATNRLGDIDPAMLRPGRFGEQIYIPLPDLVARRFLLEKKLKKYPGGESIDFDNLAVRTEQLSGADIDGLIEKIVDPSFERALRSGRIEPITPNDIEEALQRTRPSVSKKELEKYEQFLQNR